MTLYIIYEFTKGDDSFWKPYLDLMPDVKFFCHWPEEAIRATQDGAVLELAKEYKEELDKEWINF